MVAIEITTLCFVSDSGSLWLNLFKRGAEIFAVTHHKRYELQNESQQRL